MREVLAAPAVALITLAACGGDGSTKGPLVTTEAAITTGPTTIDTPIGLAIEMEGDAGVPLSVRAGQTFYLDQIDFRASIDASSDEGISGLATTGTASELPWHGV